MKNYFLPFLLALAVLTTACGGEKAAATESEETPTTQEQEAPAENATAEQNTTSSSEPTYTVVKDGIPSPRVELTGQISGVDVSVIYGSPSVKDRDIWGALVPYGKVWRTGANEATIIKLGGDVVVEGQSLPAGKYAIFTLNEEDKSTVIFNKEYEQWGAYDYDEAKDAIRVEVAPKELEESVEKMDFVIEGNQLILRWAGRAIPVGISA
jgi:hypothetical protein